MAASRTETHKIFNDPIHGHIALPQLCVQIIDTPVFQRLRNIKQLGATYKVYPGASHNRFEHSLGVCHLAGKFVERLRAVQRELFEARPKLKTQNFEISDKDVLCVQVAGLCHDLGHGPLSHVFETYFINKLRNDEDEWKHEKQTLKLLNHLLATGVFKVRKSVTLDEQDLDEKDLDEKDLDEKDLDEKDLDEKDFKFIKELILKSDMTALKRKDLTGRTSEKDFLYEIISNDENSIDVDKWDYFARDCYHLGFKNNFDHNRLIQFSRLIEVEEGTGDRKFKRWHICYREKEVENLYHMFYSRVILHKRACLHKTTKIIEIMYMEALEKVNEYLKIKGAGGVELEKISDCINDPVAYCKLTDNIFDLIRYMYKPGNEDKVTQTDEQAIQTNENMKTRAFKQAIEILDDIENRRLYKFVGEAISERKLDQKESDIEEEIRKWETADGTRELDREDFLINVLKFSYGKEDKPVDKVYFYVKSKPEKAISIKREQVSFLLPSVDYEQVVRMYSRKPGVDNVNQCRIYFEKWCRKNNMRGKWELDNATDPTASGSSQ